MNSCQPRGTGLGLEVQLGELEMKEGVRTGPLQRVPVVVKADKMKAGRHPLIWRPTGRSKARKIGTRKCVLDDAGVTSLAHVRPSSSVSVLGGRRAFNDAPQVVKMKIARFPPR